MKFKLPKRISEANIQAEFYSQCKSNNINVYHEYKYEECRFDAVIYEHDKIILIVEFKSYKRKRKPNYETKQIQKYKKYNIPILIVGRMEDVKRTVNYIKFCRE